MPSLSSVDSIAATRDQAGFDVGFMASLAWLESHDQSSGWNPTHPPKI